LLKTTFNNYYQNTIKVNHYDVGINLSICCSYK